MGKTVTRSQLKHKVEQLARTVGLDLPGLTIGGSPALTYGGQTTVSPGFGTWRNPNPDRPVLAVISATVQSDGTANGRVAVDADLSGGTTADFTEQVAWIDADISNGGHEDSGTHILVVPPGASYRVVNASDPNAANTLDGIREITL